MLRDILLITFICAVISDVGWCRPPVIKVQYPKEFIRYPSHPKELVVAEGGTFHLRCEHTSHVNFSLPSYIIPHDEEVPWTVTITGTYSAHVSGKRIYVADLEVTNPTHRETGYIYCLNDYALSNSDVENAAAAYVYVKGDEDNIITVDELQHSIFYPIQYKPLIIPCLPTSPDVTVDLELADGEFTLHSTDEAFDPRVGFTVHNMDIHHDGNFECTATRKEDGATQTHTGVIRVMPVKDYVEKPQINSTVFQFVAGSSLTLQCIVIVDVDTYFRLYWVLPDSIATNGVDRVTNHTTTLQTALDSNGNNRKVGSVLVTINRVMPSDSGTYKCVVNDHNNNTASAVTNVTVYAIDNHFINLMKQPKIVEKAGETVKWVVPYSANPAVKITWNFKNKPLVPSHHHVINTTAFQTKLEIHDISHHDSGVYTLQADNKYAKEYIDLELEVKVAPIIRKMHPRETYFNFPTTYDITCEVIGHPTPNITWYFRPCNEPPDCSGEERALVLKDVTRSNNASHNYRKAEQSGYLTCEAENSEGKANQTMTFWVSDVNNGFDVKRDPDRVYVGDNVTLHCGASKYNYTDSIQWNFAAKNQSPVSIKSDNGKFLVETSSSNFSYKSRLTISNVTNTESGNYSCVARDKIGQERNYIISVDVREPKAPTMISTNMKVGEMSVKTGSEVKFSCKVEGDPMPMITWLKDGAPLIDNKGTIKYGDKNQTIDILAALEEGTYSCRASNRVGEISEAIQLTFNDKESHTVAYIVIGIFTVSLVVLLVVLLKKIIKEKQLRDEVRRIGLDHFEKGALDSINPDLPIDDQAELLPYDRKWEFPSDKLKLGKQLGAGAFGVVMKAEAHGITEGEAVTTVAVKMVKRNADASYIKALASELKIMVHLGKHLNVVNLLGACTKNLNKRELYVIVEYCRFGNLHNYLLRHRSDFIDQVDPVTGKIDPNIGADVIARHEAMMMKNNRADSDISVEYRPHQTSGDSSDNVNYGAPLISMAPVGGNIYLGEEGMLLSNNSIQPEWRSNYGGDYKDNVRPICTRDLLCWAFQVARGMEYLAGRKVLHGDLAARNILLADDNIVKICDFGLAKSMYKSENYRKKGDGPLPIKWMAIESIRDRVFSTQSDVWSFGIVLWEFFSLARTPYPGMEADEKLYNKLIEGYRMDKPEYSTDEIHKIMDQCWKSQPCGRPSFGDLSEYLGNMLEESVRMHYIDLNDPYMSMNDQWREGQKSDYLAMVTAPTYDNMVAPSMEDVDLRRHYVNGSVVVEPMPGPSTDPDDASEGSGYLMMKPSSVIFSPRSVDSINVFNFPQKRQTRSDSQSEQPESRRLTDSSTDEYKQPSLKPQLVNNLNKNSANIAFDENIHAGDAKASKPNFTPSFSNPSYQSMPPILNVSKDNYVNMPQNGGVSGGDGFTSNGGVVEDGKVGEDYVNMPKHGHSLSDASSGFQSDSGERSSL